MASGVLTIIALLAGFVASVLTSVGLLLAYRRSSWRKRRSCFCSAAVVMFLAGMQQLQQFIACVVRFTNLKTTAVVFSLCYAKCF